MNDIVRDWIDELKQIERINQIQRKQLIQFDNYFKYSGEVEEEKKEKDFESNKVICKKIVTDDPIIQFYFDVPGYTLEEIAQVFGVQESVVSNNLDEYFKEKENAKINGKDK
jgi:hypothetical protein|tara:strand:- start:3391 stop:3726 length:336 start_codon:yes stop_codon:yes gene_type:complete